MLCNVGSHTLGLMHRHPLRQVVYLVLEIRHALLLVRECTVLRTSHSSSVLSSRWHLCKVLRVPLSGTPEYQVAYLVPSTTTGTTKDERQNSSEF